MLCALLLNDAYDGSFVAYETLLLFLLFTWAVVSPLILLLLLLAVLPLLLLLFVVLQLLCALLLLFAFRFLPLT